MKTQDLVVTLARQVEPVDRNAPLRELIMVLLGGTAAALLIMELRLGLNPQLGAFMAEPMFWVKLGFGAALALAAWPAVRALARPGMPVPTPSRIGLVLPLLLVWLLAAVALMGAAPEQRGAMMTGSSWQYCPLRIVMLGAPLLVLGLLWLRRLAPTLPAQAGGAVGLLAGGIGSAVYALHCAELAAPFLAIWYVLGVAICVALGAALGSRLLRW